MFKISRKKILLRSLIVFVFIASAISTAVLLAVNKNDQQTNAKTGDDTQITVNPWERTIYYGEGNHTDNYSITNNQGEVITVYCAEAQKDSPHGLSAQAEYVPNSTDNNAIRLAIYLNQDKTSAAAKAARYKVYDGWSSENADEEYAWTHAIVSEIYSGYYGQYETSARNAAWVNNAIVQLKQLISDNDDAWVMAKSYQLYKADTPNGKQDVVWIENKESYGVIDVQKCDKTTEACTPQGGANFDGITFKVYYYPDNQDSKIYNPHTKKIYEKGDEVASGTTNGQGELRFSNLWAASGVKYRVEEKKTNSSYELTAGAQTASLTEADQVVKLKFYNDVITGNIKVNKVDSRTGSCPGQGDGSFNGATFELWNNTGRAIVYNNQSIADGNKVATKQLSGNACSVTFSNLPIGTYTIEETAAGTGYNIAATSKPVTIDGPRTVTLEFENEIITGEIVVRKKDNKTNSSIPQGNATFDGTTFELTNESDKPIYYGGGLVAKGGVVDILHLQNGAQTVTFSGLPYGKYKVEETEAGMGYTATTSTKEITVHSNGAVTTDFGNDPILGDLTVKIIDEDTGSCVNTRGLTFNNAKFTVKNTSKNPILYNGTSIASGASFPVQTYVNDNCSITIKDLPLGSFEVTQTGVTEGYSKDNNTYKPSITINNLHPVVTLIDKPFRGDVKFVKMDETNNKPMKDVIFSISAIDENYNIIESHLFVTNSEGVFDTSSTFAPHTNNTNGYDPLYDEVDPIFFSGYGTWFGTDELGNPIRTVDNEGALPYGRYIIQELKCGSNLFCTGIKDQKATITINAQNQVIDLHDWNNTCAKFSLETEASDPKDGDKYIEITKEAKIKDKIDYCVKPKMDFTIKGVLMDKATGEKLLINGQPVEETISLNSETDCGETEMIFTLDASELGGKEIVVFETLYYKEDVIVSHEAIDDDAQTVEMVYLKTYATNNLTGEKTLPYDSYAEIKDVVKYCLKPGLEYTFKGALMNKETNKGVWYEDKPVAEEYTFTPTEACGEFEMIYKLNTKGLDGANLVIFEALYRDDEQIVKHIDINNTDETVTVDVPAPETPDTGLFTNKKNGANESNSMIITVGIVVFVSLGGYIAVRGIAKKKIFKKKIDF